MKAKTNVSKRVSTIVLVLALAFSSNIYATSGGWWNKKRPKRFKIWKIFKPKKKHNNPNSIPVDGGLSILLLGAAAFGVKKLRENKD